MSYTLIAVATIALLAVLIVKVRGYFLKAKDTVLVKEDEALSAKENTLEQKVDALSLQHAEASDLTPEEAEKYWNSKK